jgi:hypothetical protein
LLIEASSITASYEINAILWMDSDWVCFYAAMPRQAGVRSVRRDRAAHRTTLETASNFLIEDDERVRNIIHPRPSRPPENGCGIPQRAVAPEATRLMAKVE